MTKRNPKKPEFRAEPVQGWGTAQAWRVFEGERLEFFVEKIPNSRTDTHPFKVFVAVCGQGPVRRGAMIHTSYFARTPEAAAREAQAVRS